MSVIRDRVHRGRQTRQHPRAGATLGCVFALYRFDLMKIQTCELAGLKRRPRGLRPVNI